MEDVTVTPDIHPSMDSETEEQADDNSPVGYNPFESYNPDETQEQGDNNNPDVYNPAESYNPDDFITMPRSHKRNALTLKQKADIIAAYDQNPSLSKVELARRFNLSRTTLHSIVQKRDAIAESMRKFGSYSSMRKKSRTSPFQDIEGKLLMWMEYAKERKIPVNGFTLRRQAMAIARDTGCEKFTASNGWIERFKSRHNDLWKSCKSSGNTSKEEDVKDHIPIEPTVEIKEEPIDYEPTPSTSTNEEFILPHEESQWTPPVQPEAVLEPQLTLSVANLASTSVQESPDVAEPVRKKRKVMPTTSVVPSTNGPEARPLSPVYNLGDSSNTDSTKESKKDQFDVFGEYIAAKLRSLDKRSRAFAQKAIGDIIFEAEMGKYLNEDCEDKALANCAS